MVVTYSFHHKSRLELEHMSAVGYLVETAINFHLDQWTYARTVFNTLTTRYQLVINASWERPTTTSNVYRTKTVSDAVSNTVDASHRMSIYWEQHPSVRLYRLQGVQAVSRLRRRQLLVELLIAPLTWPGDTNYLHTLLRRRQRHRRLIFSNLPFRPAGVKLVYFHGTVFR